MTTIITAGTGKAVGKDAAFQVFAKRLFDVAPYRLRSEAEYPLLH